MRKKKRMMKFEIKTIQNHERLIRKYFECTACLFNSYLYCYSYIFFSFLYEGLFEKKKMRN